MRTTWPEIGLPPLAAAVQFSQAEFAPASDTAVPGTPGIDGIASVPDPGGVVIEEPGTVVPGDDGTVSGSPYASLLGDNVPALVTASAVVALMSAVMTCDGVAVVAADKYRADKPATWGDAMEVPD